MCSDLDGKGKLSGGPKEVPQNPALAYAFEASLPYSIVTAVEFNHQVRDGLVLFLYA